MDIPFSRKIIALDKNHNEIRTEEPNKISIILPIKDYNNDLLERCIKSILSQSYVHFEVIVKCNCTNEDFISLKDRFRDNRLIFVNKEDSSITEAANQAAELVTGNIMTLFSHDDYYMPDAFKILIDNIDDSVWYFGKINYYCFNSLSKTCYIENPTIESMMLENKIPQPACFWKTHIYKTVGKFDENFKLCWDYDYWIRLMKIYKPKYINYIFAEYNLNENSISIKYPDLMNSEKRSILLKHFNQ